MEEKNFAAVDAAQAAEDASFAAMRRDLDFLEEIEGDGYFDQE